MTKTTINAFPTLESATVGQSVQIWTDAKSCWCPSCTGTVERITARQIVVRYTNGNVGRFWKETKREVGYSDSACELLPAAQSLKTSPETTQNAPIVAKTGECGGVGSKSPENASVAIASLENVATCLAVLSEMGRAWLPAEACIEVSKMESAVRAAVVQLAAERKGMLSALCKLTHRANGSLQVNPWAVPEFVGAMETIGRAIGVSDKYSVNETAFYLRNVAMRSE
jgi:hypothetical protein